MAVETAAFRPPFDEHIGRYYVWVLDGKTNIKKGVLCHNRVNSDKVNITLW